MPMWTDGDCWVAEASNPDHYCPHFDDLLEDTSRSMAQLHFPHAHPCFEGDMRPFLDQRARAEANELARELVEDILLRVDEGPAPCKTHEEPFDIYITMPAHVGDALLCIQVYPWYPPTTFPQYVFVTLWPGIA